MQKSEGKKADILSILTDVSLQKINIIKLGQFERKNKNAELFLQPPFAQNTVILKF